LLSYSLRTIGAVAAIEEAVVLYKYMVLYPTSHG